MEQSIHFYILIIQMHHESHQEEHLLPKGLNRAPTWTLSSIFLIDKTALIISTSFNEVLLLA